MFDKLKKSLGLRGASPQAALAPQVRGPYPQNEVNVLYHLLFCDVPELYHARGNSPAPWQAALFRTPPDVAAIVAITNDETAESRVRLLAYDWLRKHGHEVPKKKLEGVVVEVPLDHGLDVIAAYRDGSVRYIHQTGKTSIFEGGPPEVVKKGLELIAASRLVVDRIGPWGKQRLLPPKQGNIRLSFLVSDGLYFGEGEFAAMEKEALAAPVIRCATELLNRIVKR